MTKTLQPNFSKSQHHNQKEVHAEIVMEQLFAKEIAMLKEIVPAPRPEMIENLQNAIKNIEIINKQADLSAT